MKTTSGYLFQRGKSQRYYLKWTFKGKRFAQALRDDQGVPITEKRAAEAAMEKVLRPFQAASATDATRLLVATLQGKEADLADLQDQQNPPLAISEAWTKFLATKPDAGPDTLQRYKYQWDEFSDWLREKCPAKLYLRDVTDECAAEYVKTLDEKRVSYKTVNKAIMLLRMVFRELAKPARITVSPFRPENIKNRKKPKKASVAKRKELSTDELKRVIASATGELKVLLALGIYSGLRLGDCCTLKWSEVDLPQNKIRRVPSKTSWRDDSAITIPIHPALRGLLAEIPAASRGEYVLPVTAKAYAHRVNEVTDSIMAHFAANGIETTVENPNGKRRIVVRGFHSLRHSFVSMCAENNTPVAVVQQLVGHSSATMTGRYTHVGNEATAAAVALLPDVLSDDKGKPDKASPAAIVAQVRAIAETMTPANLTEKKAALLALLAAC